MKYTTSGARSRGHPSPNLLSPAAGLHGLITDQQWLASRVIVRMLLLIIAARDKSPPKYCGSEGFDAIWARAATQRCQLSTTVPTAPSRSPPLLRRGTLGTVENDVRGRDAYHGVLSSMWARPVPDAGPAPWPQSWIRSVGGKLLISQDCNRHSAVANSGRKLLRLLAGFGVHPIFLRLWHEVYE